MKTDALSQLARLGDNSPLATKGRVATTRTTLPLLVPPCMLACLLGLAIMPAAVWGQAVCLPAPRLLTTLPMGGQVGSQIEVTISGDNLEEVEELHFSHPGIIAVPVKDAQGTTVPNRFLVTIAQDCPPGVYEARVLSRLGISSSRVFSVGNLPEVTRDKPNTTLNTAFSLALDTICNAVMTNQAVDHYKFTAEQGQRVIVDCAAGGIDSKLQPVVILANAQGGDLLVERRGGSIDFQIPATGEYVVKVHDLTYKGGAPYFYRLALRTAPVGQSVPSLPGTRNVNAFSWPPPGLPELAALGEDETIAAGQAQQITLPVDLSGRFYPAADVDTYEFTASKGEVWWVEVASERLGRTTDPAIIVHHVAQENGVEKLTEVAELNDIPSPIKVSSNGYSYDGPPYNAGSTDILAKLEIKQDGLHRLEIYDLFGGTRTDPRNEYRLIIRKAAPDFALVGWALHMNLRNGDRNALSKPIALRGGSTMAMEVLAIRRDGFNGEIQLEVEGLPAGVTATGIKIPAGETRGIVLITADSDAPRGMSLARLHGTAEIEGVQTKRRCFLASMKWPVPDASQEIPQPRLELEVPVSVNGSEQAPLTITPATHQVWEARAGEKLTIPLNIISRCDHSGTTVSLSTFCAGMGRVPAFDINITQPTAEAVIDLAALKTPPGEYQLAFYGSAVAKYRYHPEAVTQAEQALLLAKQEAEQLEAEAKSLAELAKSVMEEERANVEKTAQEAMENHKKAVARMKAAEQALQAATSKAKPKDIVDIVVSTPCSIRVLPVENK